MKFYVIYTADIPRGRSIQAYRPPMGQWHCTEKGRVDEDYAHWGKEWQEGSKHRKWVGLVTRESLERLLRDSNMVAEDVETMGSITEFGWLPAISFSAEMLYSDDGVLNAYVTPVPEITVNGHKGEGHSMDERDWQRVRHAMISCYGR